MLPATRAVKCKISVDMIPSDSVAHVDKCYRSRKGSSLDHRSGSGVYRFIGAEAGIVLGGIAERLDRERRVGFKSGDVSDMWKAYTGRKK